MTAASRLPPDVELPVLDWEHWLPVHEPWLRRVILARTAEPQAVDEVWQQVALAAIEQRWPLRDPARIAPWLHRLVVVAAARHCRQMGRQRRALLGLAQRPATSSTTTDPLGLLVHRERVALTRQALKQLAPRDTEILTLKYDEQWSYAQIAEHLGITQRAVDNRLLRARNMLRRALASLGIAGDES